MNQSRFLLGYDIGSSSIKASLVNIDSGVAVATATSPEKEMKIIAHQPDWAEQDPDMWWEHIVKATHKLTQAYNVSGDQIKAIGISYQMHGLVAVDKNHNVLRPSIIWCDSRAVDIGNKAFEDIGAETSLRHFLNSPGNFTASKLRWVQINEPQVYEQIYKVMLPGDYIAMKLSGTINTTVSGLSEGIFWDFLEGRVANRLLDYYQIDPALLPEIKSSFEVHSELSSEAASLLGLAKGTPISYRAGDQPNNAFSLNVLHPGEVAATAGTSGVVYGVTDKPDYDPQSRVNTFVHVNHTPDQARYGILLCINGTGILNSWLKHNLGLKSTLSYEELNNIASESPIGADGLSVLPFGNGAERILGNRNIGASFHGLEFNRHTSSHMLRAAQEGIVYSLHYGFQIINKMGMQASTVKAGDANMFLSPLFKEAFVNTTGCTLELYNTDGAQGAARGAGIGAGIYSSAEEAFNGLRVVQTVTPNPEKQARYAEGYQRWLRILEG